MRQKKFIAGLVAMVFLLFVTTLGARFESVGAPSIATSTVVAQSPEMKPPQIEVKPRSEWYEIVRVIDGDTIEVKIDGVNEKVRLIGLDTPEIVDPRKKVQCFGKEASDAAHRTLDGTSVRLEYDPSQGQRDKYGRLLAYVWVVANPHPEGLPAGRQGILFNKYMIAEGYGHEYTYNIPYKYQTEFKAAEDAARAAKKGLWADEACAAESARPK